jgi:alcohol dehydrogenase class IV
MIISEFTFQKTPRIFFGSKSLNYLTTILKEKKVDNTLMITGKNSLKKSGKLEIITSLIKESSAKHYWIKTVEEPTVEFIDAIVKEFRNINFDVIISIGGGSSIDTGKAISAMLLCNDSIVNYLDGVGTKKHDGRKIPFIAIPTTAGTGSEATNNAVIRKKGVDGFKRSLRHNNFIPDFAIVDPELTITQPKEVSTFAGLDALTQLIEAFVSTKASAMTDSLNYSGLKDFYYNLIKVCTNDPNDINARSCLSYGALVSGITLTNAGLGIVHGFASEIGGLYNVSHGAICASLLLAATKVNIETLKSDTDRNLYYLKKYATIGQLINKDKTMSSYIDSCNYLIDKLTELSEILKIPKLSTFGISEAAIPEIIKRVGQKNNPVKLTNLALENILKLSL